MAWELGNRFCKRASHGQLECAAQGKSWPTLCIWLASVVWAKPSSGSFQLIRYFGNLHLPPPPSAASNILPAAVLPAQHGAKERRSCHRLHWGCTWLGVLFVLSFLSACCADMSLHKCCLVLLFIFFLKNIQGYKFIVQNVSYFKGISWKRDAHFKCQFGHRLSHIMWEGEGSVRLAVEWGGQTEGAGARL